MNSRPTATTQEHPATSHLLRSGGLEPLVAAMAKMMEEQEKRLISMEAQLRMVVKLQQEALESGIGRGGGGGDASASADRHQNSNNLPHNPFGPSLTKPPPVLGGTATNSLGRQKANMNHIGQLRQRTKSVYFPPGVGGGGRRGSSVSKSITITRKPRFTMEGFMDDGPQQPNSSGSKPPNLMDIEGSSSEEEESDGGDLDITSNDSTLDSNNHTQIMASSATLPGGDVIKVVASKPPPPISSNNASSNTAKNPLLSSGANNRSQLTDDDPNFDDPRNNSNASCFSGFGSFASPNNNGSTLLTVALPTAAPNEDDSPNISNKELHASGLQSSASSRMNASDRRKSISFASIPTDLHRHKSRLACPGLLSENPALPLPMATDANEANLFGATLTVGGSLNATSFHSASKRSGMKHNLTEFQEGMGDREDEENTVDEKTGAPRKRMSMSRDAFVQNLLSLAERPTFFTRTVGSDHWLAAMTDVSYMVISTLMMYVTLTSIASPSEDAHPPSTIAVDVIVSLLTLLFMAIKTRTRTRLNEWEVVDDAAVLQRSYLKSWWFALDLATVIPVEMIFIVWAPLGFSICLLRHILRLPRMLTLYRSTHPLLEERQWFTSLFIVAMAVLIIEVAAQIFIETEDDSTSHLDAVYWTVTTITSVGYGDILPTSEGSKLLSIFVQIAGISIVAGMTSVATQQLTDKDPIKVDYERRKKMMYSMLSFYDVPWGVQKEVIAQFPSLLADYNEDQFHDLANNLPQAIGRKIEVFMRRKMVSNVPLFRDLGDQGVLLEIATLLTGVMYQPLEYIVHAGDVGQEMFFIASGGVDILVPVDEELETVVAVLRTGQWFGEIALLLEVERTASVQATEVCEMLVLSKTSLIGLADRNRALRETLDEEVSHRLEEMELEKMKHKKGTSFRKPSKCFANPEDEDTSHSNVFGEESGSGNNKVVEEEEGLPTRKKKPKGKGKKRTAKRHRRQKQHGDEAPAVQQGTDSDQPATSTQRNGGNGGASSTFDDVFSS